MSTQTIIIIIIIAIVMIVVLAWRGRGGPRVTEIDRTVKRKKEGDGE
jgi:hypothetical protein